MIGRCQVSSSGIINFIRWITIMFNRVFSKMARFGERETVITYLEKSILFLMGIFIFCIPFPFKTSISEICFYGSVMIFIVLIAIKKTRPSFDTPLSFPLLLFLLWAIFGLCFSLNRENTLADIIGHLVKEIIVFCLLVTFFCTKRRFYNLTLLILISCSLFSIGATGYFYVILGHDITTRLSLPQIDFGTNYFGYVTVNVVIISMIHAAKTSRIYQKIILLIPFITAVITSLLTGTRGTILGIIAPLIFLFPKFKKSALLFLFIVFSMIPLLSVKTILQPDQLMKKIQLEERKQIWPLYFQIIKEYPLTGIGFGMQTYDENLFRQYNLRLAAEARVKTYYTPHNLFIDVAVRVGLIGLLIFMYIVYTVIRMGWLLITQGRDDFIRSWALGIMVIFLSYLIQAMFTDFFLSAQAIWFFIVLALMTILYRLNENPDNGTIIV
jgi:O-antigen ligase